MGLSLFLVFQVDRNSMLRSVLSLIILVVYSKTVSAAIRPPCYTIGGRTCVFPFTWGHHKISLNVQHLIQQMVRLGVLPVWTMLGKQELSRTVLPSITRVIVMLMAEFLPIQLIPLVLFPVPV